MNKIDEKKVKDLIHTIGLLNNMSDKDVKDVVESQFRFTCEVIKKLSFDNLTEEEINNLKTNFYFKYLGKLHTSSDIINRQKRKEEIIKEKQNERD